MRLYGQDYSGGGQCKVTDNFHFSIYKDKCAGYYELTAGYNNVELIIKVNRFDTLGDAQEKAFNLLSDIIDKSVIELG